MPPSQPDFQSPSDADGPGTWSNIHPRETTSNGAGVAPAHSHAELGAFAVEAILAHRLPKRMPDGMWGGPGQGLTCAVCCQPIGSHEMEMELDFGQPTSGAVHPRVHIPCFGAWKARLQAQHLDALPGEVTVGKMSGRGSAPARQQGAS